MLDAELADYKAQGHQGGYPNLGRILNAEIPDSWPPELYDDRAIGFVRDRLADDPHEVAWFSYYAIEIRSGGKRDSRKRQAVGMVGFKGYPDASGTVEVGYSIVPEARDRGLATEAIRALIGFAQRDYRVCRIIAETLPHLHASIRVLEKLGFRTTPESSEPGVVRYQLEPTTGTTQ